MSQGSSSHGISKQQCLTMKQCLSCLSKIPVTEAKWKCTVCTLRGDLEAEHPINVVLANVLASRTIVGQLIPTGLVQSSLPAAAQPQTITSGQSQSSTIKKTPLEEYLTSLIETTLPPSTIYDPDGGHEPHSHERAIVINRKSHGATTCEPPSELLQQLLIGPDSQELESNRSMTIHGNCKALTLFPILGRVAPSLPCSLFYLFLLFKKSSYPS